MTDDEILRELGQLHPNLRDPIESERCPECGRPGVLIRVWWPFQTWACPVCEPEAIPSHAPLYVTPHPRLEPPLSHRHRLDCPQSTVPNHRLRPAVGPELALPVCAACARRGEGVA